MTRLTIELDIETFGDETAEDVRDALRRTSTHNPMDEIEGHLWVELHERGIDSMVSIEDWRVDS
jgi:hypothetical protein